MQEQVDESPEGHALITVGITCFSEGDWVLECWHSVLAQTDNRWVAVLVMDGGASARTREVFEQLNHPKLRKFKMPANVGPYPTRNKAFELTQTPFHLYLDGDDQLLPSSVALVVQTFEKHPDAAFVYGDYQCFGADDSVWRYQPVVTAKDLVERQSTPGPCAYKVQTWLQLGGWASELARGNADYDFLIGAFEAGLRGRHCGEIFYRYRVGHSGQVSQSYKRRHHVTHEIMVRRHPGFFGDRKRRNRFLALGYRRAAIANAEAGDLKTAARLAMSAWGCGMWGDRAMQVIVLRSLLSPSIYRMLRRAWHFVRLRRASCC